MKEELSLPLNFDVAFDVHTPPHLTTTHQTDRSSEAQGTLPDDMGHVWTVLWDRDLETAALPTELHSYSLTTHINIVCREN